MTDLGRYLLGQSVPITLAVLYPYGFPAAPREPPVATVYDAAGEEVASVALFPADPAPPHTLHGAPLRLGRGFASGKFFVVSRYVATNGVPGLATSCFTVVGGGDPGGSVISLYSHDRPEARYVLGQLSGGSLVQGRDPHF